MTTSLIDLLETEFPNNKQIKLDGKVPIWIWRLELPRLMELVRLPMGTQEEQIAASIELIVASVGDSNGPGSLDNERGRAWLAMRPNAVLELAGAVRELNELDGRMRIAKKNQKQRATPMLVPPLPILGVRHPRRLIAELGRDELLDWLAMWEVDPWGPERDDIRAAAASFWNRGGEFDSILIQYPHVPSDTDDDVIALLESDAREREIDGSRA